MTEVKIDPGRDMLGIIDVQPTFMPGGELPVAGGDEVVAPINRLLEAPFGRAFATQDWHPAGHASFASRHPGRAAFEEIELGGRRQVLWPDHAVAGSARAALAPGLRTDRIEWVVRKGTRLELDSYSAFFDNDRATPTGLAGALRELGVTRVFLVGLAYDYCVAWSAEDAARLGFDTFVVEDACRAIGSVEETRARLIAAGAKVVTSDSLV